MTISPHFSANSFARCPCIGEKIWWGERLFVVVDVTWNPTDYRYYILELREYKTFWQRLLGR